MTCENRLSLPETTRAHPLAFLTRSIGAPAVGSADALDDTFVPAEPLLDELAAKFRLANGEQDLLDSEEDDSYAPGPSCLLHKSAT